MGLAVYYEKQVVFRINTLPERNTNKENNLQFLVFKTFTSYYKSLQSKHPKFPHILSSGKVHKIITPKNETLKP